MGNACTKRKKEATAFVILATESPTCVNSPCDKSDACENLTLDVNDMDTGNRDTEWWLTHLSHAMLCTHTTDVPYVRALIDGLDRCTHHSGVKPCYPF